MLCHLPTWCELNSEPDAQWHDAVVNHVQGGDVVVLLAQNKEYLPEENSHITICDYLT